MALVGALHGIGSLFLLGLAYAIVLRPKTRPARHQQLGRLYARVSFPILVLGFIIGLRHWPSLTPFQIVVPPTIAAVAVGWWAATPGGRRRLGPAWIRVHIGGMGGSVIAWSTGFGFQVALRAGIPIDAPPVTIALFALPTIVGTPLINWAVAARLRATEPPGGGASTHGLRGRGTQLCVKGHREARPGPVGADEPAGGGARDVRGAQAVAAEADVRGDRVASGEVLDLRAVR